MLHLSIRLCNLPSGPLLAPGPQSNCLAENNRPSCRIPSRQHSVGLHTTLYSPSRTHSCCPIQFASSIEPISLDVSCDHWSPQCMHMQRPVHTSERDLQTHTCILESSDHSINLQWVLYQVCIDATHLTVALPVEHQSTATKLMIRNGGKNSVHKPCSLERSQRKFLECAYCVVEETRGVKSSFSHCEKAMSHNFNNDTQARQVIRRKPVQKFRLLGSDHRRLIKSSLWEGQTSSQITSCATHSAIC